MKGKMCAMCGEREATKVFDMKYYCRKCWKKKHYEKVDELLGRDGNEAKIDKSDV